MSCQFTWTNLWRDVSDIEVTIIKSGQVTWPVKSHVISFISHNYIILVQVRWHDMTLSHLTSSMHLTWPDLIEVDNVSHLFRKYFSSSILLRRHFRSAIFSALLSHSDFFRRYYVAALFFPALLCRNAVFGTLFFPALFSPTLFFGRAIFYILSFPTKL